MPDAQQNSLAGARVAAAARAVRYQQTRQACYGGQAREHRGPAHALEISATAAKSATP
jgi:hypothetical protein